MIPSWNRWPVRLQGNRYVLYGNSLPSSCHHPGDCASHLHVAGDDELHGLRTMPHDASENPKRSAKVLRDTGDTTFWGPHNDAPGATPMPACPVWMSMMGIRSQVVRTGSTQRSAGKAMESPWMGEGELP